MKKTLILVWLCLFIVSCGGGGGGSSSSSSSGSSSLSEKLLGNFQFVYTLVSEYTDKVTIDRKGTTQTSEGTDIYLGHYTDTPNFSVAGAWYPSHNKYLVVSATVTISIGSVYQAYAFVIEGDGRLTGCYYITINGAISSCYSLNSSTSRKTARTSGLTARSNTIEEDMALKARESNSDASVREEDADMKAKIAELRAVLGSTEK